MTSPASRLILFFIADNPSVDFNRDLFTWAPSKEDAIADWQANYETRDLPEGVFTVPTEQPTRGPIPWDIIRTEMLK